jgi:hypothetical protein
MKHAQRPLTHILAMKDWNAAKRKWIGTTEEALDEELHLSMVMRPWLKDAEQFWGGSIKEPEHLEQ